MFHLRPRSVGLGLACLCFLLCARARAESVDQLITLLDKKPAGMNDDVWREKRREAARELGRMNDKKAVPALIRVVETEKFDAVAEIAIDSLARLGDKRAVEPLRKVSQDASRDKFMRDAAANALRRLGQAPPEGAPEPEPEPEPEPQPTPGGTGPGKGPVTTPTPNQPPGPAPQPPPEPEVEPEPDDEDLSPPEGPGFPADVLAAFDRWTFAIGSLALAYDSVQKRPYLAGAASARWQLGREKPGFGWSLDTGAAFAGGAQDRDRSMADTSSIAMDFQLGTHAEGRFYLGTPGAIFAGVDAALGLGLTAAKIETNTPMNMDYEDFAPEMAVNLGVGVGYGRILDVGVTMRLRRVEAVLRRARLLGRPVNPDVARRIFSAWWALSGEIGVRHRLVATIQLLRDAGVLLSDPPPAVTYEILRVLEDGQLDLRFEGMELRAGVGETFVYHDPIPQADDLELERIETAYHRGLYGKQLAGGSNEIIGATQAVYRLSGDPGFWSAQAEVVWRRFFYGSAWDPRGALQLGVTLGLSDLNTEDSEDPAVGPGTRLAGTLGYLWLANRASRTLLAADLSIEGDLFFVGARLEFNYGLLDSVLAPY
jgi:hypothetical protein